MNTSSTVPSQDMNEAPATQAVTPLASKPFLVSGAEVAFALLSYVAAYLYTRLWFNDLGLYSENTAPLWRVLPIAVFAIAAGLVLNRKKKASAESWFWLACFGALSIALTFRIYAVWDEPQLFMLVHAAIVWWVLARSGKLLEKESSHFLPMDVINGLFVIPFLQFFLRIRTWIKALANAAHKSRGKRQNLWWILGALILSLILLYAAIRLLSRADSQFSDRMEGLISWLRIDSEFLVYFIFSLPIGAYIYALIGGSARMDDDLMRRQKSALERFLTAIRRVPAAFWAVIILIFSVLYIAFFALQASYFLGAFTHTLPEGFIVSRFAREGFFELCRVMALNFALLWLVTRMSEQDTKNSKLLKISCLLLLLESLLFAVIAASKICLYVSNFGWTPKRIQSLWLVAVLAGACLAWAIHLLSGKKTLKPWLILSAATLTLLTFLPL